MTFGDKLINLRKQKKMTQDESADKLGVTRQTISNWELNQTKPDLDQLKAISKLYKISLDELTDNDVKELINEKVSNVEKLSGLIYKILKFMLFTFIGGILLMLIGVILFIANGGRTTISTMTSTYCNLNNKYYDIVIESKDENPIKINGLGDLENKINVNKSQSATKIMNNIVDYIEANGGSCE